MNIKERLLDDLNFDSDISYEDVAAVPDNFEGDYSIPCFKLAKKYKKSPALIAKDFAESYVAKGLVKKVFVVGPYINVVLNRAEVAKFVCRNIFANENYGRGTSGVGKTVCIDYSSITLSKQIHIGHLCTTVIGECLAKLYENAGYKVVRINYLGDMGTPFGKIITVYKKCGYDKSIEELTADDVQKLYAQFATLEKEDDNLISEAREWSLKIEQNDDEAVALCNGFKNVALKEAKNMYHMLGIDFDDWRGEAYYNDKTDSIIEMLDEKDLLVESNGAKCVNLENYDMGMCLVQRSDGGSLYTTRDLAAAIDRFNRYGFSESIYVTGIEQKHHFESFFKVLELAGYDWANNLKYVGYGRMSTEFGKISGREGHTPIVKEIFNSSIEKAKTSFENRDVEPGTASAIGVSAVVFGVLKTERMKDTVFSLEQAINFDGDTSVYIQYSYVRLKTILGKIGLVINADDSLYDKLEADEEFMLLLKLDEFGDVLSRAQKDCEPCYVARYALELATLVNRFYHNVRVISDNRELVNARGVLCQITSDVLKKSMNILGIKIIEKM